ncbi:MAG TPA: trehalase family glycosidase [Vicinamibacterales bacterium]|nr:trehalase family glycosidase [Vicinamibacterales bacterium]
MPRRPLKLGVTSIGVIAIALTLADAQARAVGRQAAASQAASFPSATQIQDVRRYIKRTWTVLTRSARDLPLAAPDPKIHRAPGEAWPVYVAGDENREAIARSLRAVLSPADLQHIELRTLPTSPAQIRDHGLLYLPHRYVVPGGRFNEMYGWDSYFIQLGLLRDGEIGLARDMTDNFLYEITHYGTILNANRTYYLTRSQPPFLTEMILGVFDRTRDRRWLQSTLPSIDMYYAFWTSPPHRVEANGLSRYFDLGEGPAPEVVTDERDAQGQTHYDRVREYYRTHEVTDYDVSQYYDRGADRLTAAFFTGDRSMRESGFDPSNRFGPFSADIVHYTPVCLNVLLYRMEDDAARIHSILGNRASAAEWQARAQRRRTLIDQFLWDPDAGLYFDYNFETERRRRYEFATTFYPLWAGIASADQARRVVANLSKFEAPGGVLTSTQTTGSQWDAPYGWAPLQIIAVDGLRRYGYDADADRLARKFVSLVVDDFAAHGTIVEKYDVRRRSSDLGAGLRFGYTSNEVGFGWTNAAILDLLAGLTRGRRAAAVRGAFPAFVISVPVQPATGGTPRELSDRRERLPAP